MTIARADAATPVPCGRPGQYALTATAAAHAVMARCGDAVRRVPLDAGFAAAVELVASLRGRVITIGVGTSADLARLGAHLLASCDTPAQFLHATDVLHGGIGAVTAEDVVLAISARGSTPEVLAAASAAELRGARVIALTSRASSDLARVGRIDVVLPAAAESVPLSSVVARAAWFGAFAEAVRTRRG
ncbi:hypothetical protein GCM10022247_35210 [Allokutzneria multivorans]|uniref:SIS domain-containing protein n=1 Tax=Allokutzneria multivorans TaxID=1142134 RepID=A0ABP7SDB5_9PSEU